jgi:hypothetical protein
LGLERIGGETLARPTLTLANVYTLIVKIGSTLATDETWRNTYDIFASAGPPAPTATIVETILDFAQRNLASTAQIFEAELRNWTFGPQPYGSGVPIWSETLVLPGTKVSAYGGEGPDAVGKEVVAFARRVNTGPKEGKLFLRGFLDTGDIAALTGAPWEFLTPPGNVTPAKWDTNTSSSGLEAFFGTVDPGLVVAHFSYKQYQIDPTRLPFYSRVTALPLVGPTTNKPTRKSKK